MTEEFLFATQSSAQLPLSPYPPEDSLFWNNNFVKGSEKYPVAHRAFCGQEEEQTDTAVINPWPSSPVSNSKEDLLLCCSHSAVLAFWSFASNVSTQFI